MFATDRNAPISFSLSTNQLEQLLGLAAQLRTALGKLLGSIGYHSPRVRDLTGPLGLDKSTASRVVRGMRGADAATALREFPTAEGLARVVDACEAQRARALLITEAREAIGKLEGAVCAFPGGRSGLSASLAGFVTEAGSEGEGNPARARAERAARRAAFNASSYLQGISVDAAVHGLFLGPGTTAERLHQAMLNGSIGMRRLRPGPPITVSGVYGSPLSPGPPTRVTLGGEPISDDPRIALLPEFCSGATDQLRIDRAASHYLLWWEREQPPLDRPSSVAHGVKSVDFIERTKSARYHYACTNYTVRRPTKLFVLDVLVWHDALRSRGPDVKFSMDPFRVPDPIAGPPRDGRELLETTSRFVPMGRGLSRRGTARADAFLPMFARSMQLLGWAPDDFERYRLEIEFPLTFVGIQVWFELEDATAG